ncbi:MAG: GNAT family N-acetyltransferase, partial [Planctomycetota bacterium]
MMKARVAISPMQIDDCEAAIAIWSQSEGVCLSESDSRDGIARFLRRNPGSSFVARANGHIVGAVLCGHDGRRGHIYHLGVDASMRNQGVGAALLSRCMRALADSGVTVCRASVLTEN